MSEQDSPASKSGKFSQQIEFSVDAIPQQMLFHTLGSENVDILFALNDENISHRVGGVYLSNST